MCGGFRSIAARSLAGGSPQRGGAVNRGAGRPPSPPPRQKTRVQQIVVPRSTLQRREEEGRLRPAESERLERIARLATLAEQVWESPEEAQRFLTSPHPQLDNEAPIDLAASDLGTRRVETLLWKLEH